MISIRIPVSNCITGIYLRWWYNGYHYFNFTNGYEMSQRTESMDTQVTNYFSRISKTELTTRYKVTYSYQIVLEGITAGNIAGFEGLLLAERVEQYEGGLWYEVEIIRGDHIIREDNTYKLEFEITRRELPLSSTVLQKTLLLYIGTTLCDLDYDEVVPINKQVNDIAEMQDRQSDFTNTFRIRKTRRMRLLFELSGEVGATTLFPYKNQTCKLVQDGIEMISAGYMILDKSDDSYYYVTIYSGNLNFFKTIEPLKLIDLTLATTNHIWNIANMGLSHSSDLDYVYPLCEPSDKGGMFLIDSAAESIEFWGGSVWPFIKVKAVWDEIFLNAGYSCSGNILTEDTFLNLFMPLVNRNISNINTAPWLYSLHAHNRKVMNQSTNVLDLVSADSIIILGDVVFSTYAIYVAPFSATYTFRVMMQSAGGGGFVLPLHVYVYVNGVLSVEMFDDGTYTVNPYSRAYQASCTILTADQVTFRVTITGLSWYNIQVTEITGIKINYLSTLTPRLHLPEMTQTDFVKMICNMFALIPDADPRKKEVYFWNFNDLYDNIPVARNWSAYLSEREDETEFKFGSYAQNNHLRFKKSDDVIEENGDGIMQVDDDTLPFKKEVISIPLSTCDEISLNPIFPNVNVSRINFNIYNPETGLYEQGESIDPRIVFVSALADASPPLQTLVFRDTPLEPDTNAIVIIENPKTARSLPVSFSQLMINYAGLSRLLTKTNLRRVKLNLPTYEVAGLKHYIPIYLSQYKAYFYVNKINNYIPGELCIVDLIKL